jgi:hypothetical protein
MALGGCSFAVGHHNAGIGHLQDAPAPAGALATGAKYLGWVLSAPAVLALVPVSALAWATPWVDLPLAIDICSAPGIGLGYATQALVGYPARALFFWTGPDPPRRADVRRAPRGPGPPWGLVRAHWPAEAASRAATPLSADDAARYAGPPDVTRRLSDAVAVAAARPGEVVSTRVDDGPVPSSIEVTWADVTWAEGAGSRPLVVMTPPAEAAFAARWMAARFARRGAHAAVVVPDADFLEAHLAPADVERKFAAGVALARSVVDALAPRADVSRVVYVGVSAGGIFGAALMAVEPRIARAALLLPGGDLPAIIARSQEASVVAYREAWAARGVDTVALERALRVHVRTDPLRLAAHVDPSRVLLFLGARDTLVPTDCGLRLRDALGGPETYVLAGDHDTACLSFGFILRRVDAFLGL